MWKGKTEAEKKRTFKEISEWKMEWEKEGSEDGRRATQANGKEKEVKRTTITERERAKQICLCGQRKKLHAHHTASSARGNALKRLKYHDGHKKTEQTNNTLNISTIKKTTCRRDPRRNHHQVSHCGPLQNLLSFATWRAVMLKWSLSRRCLVFFS